MNASDTCAIFTTDMGYLVPTLVAAEQVHQQVQPEGLADIIIFTVDFAAEMTSKLEADFPDFRFLPVSLDIDKEAFFNASHVPRSTLARLSIGPSIPDHYENIVYLDGDIQIVGDIRPLFRHRVPAGMIAAGNESAEFFWTENINAAREFREHAATIGLTDARDYFNAGILAARRDSWIEIGEEALRFFNENSKLCLYHDQTALNAVCLGRRQILHPRYNFVSWFRYMRADRLIEPSLIHFTGAQKPWSRHRPAMKGRFIAVYEDFLARHPFLAPAFEGTSGLNWQGSGRLPRDWRLPWRIPMRRRRFQRFLNEANFAFQA